MTPWLRSGSRSVWSQRGAVGVGVLFAVVSVVSGLLVGSGNAARVLHLDDGRACMADNDPAGTSGVACPSVGSAQSDYLPVAGGTVQRVVVGADGLVWAQVKRPDGTFEWRRVGKDSSSLVAAGKEDDQIVVTGGRAAWLVDVAHSSVKSLTSGATAPVTPSLMGKVKPVAGVDGHGRLVVVTVSSIVVFDDADDRVREVGRFDTPEKLSSVVVAGEDVVLVSGIRGSAVVVDGAKGRPGKPLDLGVSGQSVLVPERSTGSALWVLDPVSGRVVGTGVDGRRVGVLELPSGVDRWDAPSVVGDVVMVSGRVGGVLELWRGNAGSGELKRVEWPAGAASQLASCGAGGCPEVFESGGRLWVNQPTADSVLVVDAAGGVRVVSKGGPEATGRGDVASAASNGDQGARVKAQSAQRGEVESVPFRSPTAGTPAGPGSIAGSSGPETAGGDGDPSTTKPTQPTPDTVEPQGGPPPDSVPGAPAAGPASVPCASDASVSGDQSRVPGAPVGLTATATAAVDGKGSITVAWKAPADGGVVCGYVISVSGPTPVNGRTVAATASSTVLDGLMPGGYSITLTASNNTGRSVAATATAAIVNQTTTPPAIPCKVESRTGQFPAEHEPLGGYLDVRPTTSGCVELFLRYTERDDGCCPHHPSASCIARKSGDQFRLDLVPSPWELLFGNSSSWSCEALSPAEGSWIRLSIHDGPDEEPRNVCIGTRSADRQNLDLVRANDVAWHRAQYQQWAAVAQPDPCALPGQGDLSGDGGIDCADMRLVMQQLGQTGPGLKADINLDQVVDVNDFGIIQANIKDNLAYGGNQGACRL